MIGIFLKIKYKTCKKVKVKSKKIQQKLFNINSVILYFALCIINTSKLRAILRMLFGCSLDARSGSTFMSSS